MTSEALPVDDLDVELIDHLQRLGKENDYKGYLDATNAVLEHVETRENGDHMVELKSALHRDVHMDLTDLKISVSNDCRDCLREGVVTRLNQAQENLPSGYHLLIRDAFRSKAVVQALYERYMGIETARGFSREEADLRIRNILAMPDDPVPPGHMTGGALDIILADENGDRIPLMVDESLIPRDRQMFTFCNELPPEILKERQILYDAMVGAGFSNYFREYWHYSYGDAYWAMRRKNKVALYGIPSEELFKK